ncbi:biotin/lipoate--protein ligase family protein [Aliiroseovarius marinus]|uniref:biotin/lipoate--protein ligase family protein n=1 Tax=Aliiroseovarius marinus TaxID=2500159 RepID=UPI00105F4F46|nr:biotin/lipoate--protein ligase family protein [Aliiroseovarius marinus]
MSDLTFPPMMSGLEVTGDDDPFAVACVKATMGCDAGLIVYRIDADKMSAALVFAPEVPLGDAMTMLPTCGIGFQNALGALAPPEVSVHLEWNGTLRVNGARCGRMRAMASTDDAAETPDWLVIGFDLVLMPLGDDPGITPEDTALFSEGCADVSPPLLLEAWARHSFNWIARWEDEGTKPVHAEWRGLAHGVGEDLTQGDLSGTFLGVDEQFGMLLRAADTTHLIPLTTVLETP